MFINRRKRGGEEYLYLEHSYRIDKKVKKVSFYIPKSKSFSFKDFSKINKKAIDMIVKDRITQLADKTKAASFFSYEGIIERIETIHVTFQLLFSQLDKSSQDEILTEFLRKFIVNSMEMEGSTITYDVAGKIDTSKLKRIPEGVDPIDIDIYNNIKETYKLLSKSRIRRAASIAKIHGMMFRGVYGFTGRFKKEFVTFGFLEKAKTSLPDKVIKDLNKAIKDYTKLKKTYYIFEAILRFHVSYQRVHPFRDGNSRLGRLLITHDFLSKGYPPPILKASDSRNYRRYLVESINHNHYSNFFKLYYKKYKSTWQRFFQPVLKDKIESSIIYKQAKKR